MQAYTYISEEKDTGGITIINNIPKPEDADGGD